MKITKRQLRKIIAEALDLDLKVGDVIMTGKFKNKRTIVKDIGTDDLGQPTINGKKVLNFRIEKLMPKSKWSKETLEGTDEDILYAYPKLDDTYVEYYLDIFLDQDIGGIEMPSQSTIYRRNIDREPGDICDTIDSIGSAEDWGY